jgi:hypothetical protein
MSRLCGLAVVLVLTLALGGPVGAAGADGGPSDAAANKPSLKHLRLEGRHLTLKFACQGELSVKAGRQRVTAPCEAGQAGVALRLTASQRHQLAKGSEVRVKTRIADARGATSLPLKLALPVKGGMARASLSGGVWPSMANGNSIMQGANATCIAGDPSDWSGQPATRQVIIESNYANFGYAVGTRLRWTAWLETYNPATGVLAWFQGYTYSHVAWGGRGASHTFYNDGRPMYYRPAIQIVGGDWNYVRIETFAGPHAFVFYASPTNWCYMARG